MLTPLKIAYRHIDADASENRIFDMTGRCAFVVCLSGDFEIAIMNSHYHVVSQSMLMCMPFVNIRLIRVREPGEVIIVGTELENIYVMSTISRSIASDNILVIKQYPVVHVDTAQIEYIQSSVNEYLNDLAEGNSEGEDETCSRIYQSIIDARSQLIVAQVLKLYFTNMPMEVRAYNHHDFVFQNFMLDLYKNFRENHNVKYYAMRSGLSLKYFSTVVRMQSGASPSEWIESVVIGEAKTMLRDATNNIKEIAASLNFPDAPTFTKYFLRVTGITPKAYRKSIS